MRRSVWVTLLAALATSCGNDGTSAPQGDTTPGVLLDPVFPPAGDFVAEIDNPYLAFQSGRIFTYEGETEDGIETIIVEVTEGTKTILGVTATVVHDQAFLDGDLVEDTLDWYAQDKDGNVWYLGEDSKEIENGQVISTDGSWEAGVDGAEPGILMLAGPKVGVRYRQEYAEGVAEDMANVKSLSETVEVPYGTFEGCLKTKEWSPLEPGAVEFKYYAPGVGLLLEEKPGGRDQLGLTAIQD